MPREMDRGLTEAREDTLPLTAPDRPIAPQAEEVAAAPQNGA